MKPFIDFNIANLERWFQTHVPEFRKIDDIEKFAVGQSNPTYLIHAGSSKYVLRKQPSGKLLKSAHAVDREYKVMSALQHSGVPVPRMIGLSEDRSVIGTLFFVMTYLEGRIFSDPSLPDLEPGERAAIYQAQTDVVIDLSNINIQDCGLDDFGSGTDYITRQISLWTRQYRASETEKIPTMENLIEWLPAHIQIDHYPRTLVHGDFRLDNMIIHPTEPYIIGLIDWELSTIGHPLVDLSYWSTMLRFPKGGYFNGVSDTERNALNIPTESEILGRFFGNTSVSLPKNWQFWIAFQCFRFTAIVQGVQKRSLQGNASATDAERVGNMARPVADLGWQIING